MTLQKSEHLKEPAVLVPLPILVLHVLHVHPVLLVHLAVLLLPSFAGLSKTHVADAEAPVQMPPSGCGAMKCHKISDALTMIRRMRRMRRWKRRRRRRRRRRRTMRRWCCLSPFTPLSDMEEQPPLAVKRPVNPKDQRHLKIKIESEKEDTGTKAFSPEVQ